MGNNENFNRIFDEVAIALGDYQKFKSGGRIADQQRGFLLVLEESNAVQKWIDNILPAYEYNKKYGRYVHDEEPERMAELEKIVVQMFLAGYSIKRISMMSEIKKSGIQLKQIKEWLYGSKRRDGLVGTMVKKILQTGAYCDFCAHLVRENSKSHLPKLTGTVCTCANRR